MTPAKTYAPWLWILLALFCFRVVAQLIAAKTSISFMPGFDDWHSGALPYSALVAAQLAIIVAMATIAYRFTFSEVKHRPALGKALLVVGSVYLGVMVVRLALGSTVYAGHPWFDKVLPTLFHMLLAAFVLVVSRFHLSKGRVDV